MGRGCGSLPGCQKIIDRLSRRTAHETNSIVITGTIDIRRSIGRPFPGRSALVRLYSGTELDPNTGRGKLSENAHLKDGKNYKYDKSQISTYNIKFYVGHEFGVPGAFVIENRHNSEFFLVSATLQVPKNQTIHFECNSWVYPISKTKTSRLFFSNTSYLPNQTPEALVELREEELKSLRGNGTGERQEWERVYDYDYYNDLGDPDKGDRYVRPILGGSESYPYPRRGRTGRPPSKQDALTESRPKIINLDIYVPPDERFSPRKLSEFISDSIQAIIHFLGPELKSMFRKNPASFKSFPEIREMFSSNRGGELEGWMVEKLKSLVPHELVKEVDHASKQSLAKFPLPQIIAENEWAWKDDAEFGREMLAGINPAVIKGLQEFPPQTKTEIECSIKASHIKHNLDGLTIKEAMKQGRILILDHHDYLLPFLERIRTQGVFIYASRTLLFLKNDETLRPLAIELSFPESEKFEGFNEVFVPASQGTEGALWQLAKTHVVINDGGYHQLISHWLKTHAVVEPFVIATRRQLSEMHPVHRLLNPHFKDTMHINALGRSVVINSGGILEKTLFPGNLCMEMSSVIYKDWKFVEQRLPVDLIKRRMAVEDHTKPSGVRLLFDDYPYAADGLDVWTIINTWVTDFCSVFYTSNEAIQSDIELQSWWSEIRNVGHGDKRNETWWYQMTTLSNLVDTLTTLIWTTSALHASLNFGQYDYAGYPPNRPTMCRKAFPQEGTLEYAEFLRDPDGYFLQMLPDRVQMTLGVAVIEVLSRHMQEEVYLGQRTSLEWIDNKEVRQRFKKFRANLRELQRKISERNNDPRLKNRRGPANIPYTLLFPDTANVGLLWGITGKGIPNSVSI